MLSSIAALFRSERRILLFGLTCAMLSSPGQTFFISLYTASLGSELALSAADLGLVYLLGTIAAAALLPLAGRWIDHIDLRAYVSAIATGLAAASFVMASAAGAFSLFLAFALLRLSAQGLMSHIAMTGTARYFHARRGAALSIVALGYPIAEAVTPLTAAALIGLIGWRASYIVIGLFVIVVALPYLLWLVKDASGFTRPPQSEAGARRDWLSINALKPVVTQPFFWLVLPILLFLPFTSTALIFHIYPVSAAQGWPLHLIPWSFALFATGHAFGLLLSGNLVDRYGAPALLLLMNAPVIAVLLLLGVVNAPVMLFALMAACGLSIGFGYTTVTSMWAEVYGVANLGAIRSFASMLMVAGTAIGPAAIGLPLDAGTSIAAVFLTLAGFGLLATLLAQAARLRIPASGQQASPQD